MIPQKSYGFILFSVQFQFLQKYLRKLTLPSLKNQNQEIPRVMILFANISSPLLLTTSYFSGSFHWGKKKVTSFDNLVIRVIHLIVSKNVEIQPCLSISNSGKWKIHSLSEGHRSPLPSFPAFSFYINYLYILSKLHQETSCRHTRFRYDFNGGPCKFRCLSICIKLQS